MKLRSNFVRIFFIFSWISVLHSSQWNSIHNENYIFLTFLFAENWLFGFRTSANVGFTNRKFYQIKERNEINTIAAGHLVTHFEGIDFILSLSGQWRFFSVSHFRRLYTSHKRIHTVHLLTFFGVLQFSSVFGTKVPCSMIPLKSMLPITDKKTSVQLMWKIKVFFFTWKVLWSLWPITLHMIIKKPSKNALATNSHSHNIQMLEFDQRKCINALSVAFA